MHAQPPAVRASRLLGILSCANKNGSACRLVRVLG